MSSGTVCEFCSAPVKSADEEGTWATFECGTRTDASTLPSVLRSEACRDRELNKVKEELSKMTLRALDAEKSSGEWERHAKSLHDPYARFR